MGVCCSRCNGDRRWADEAAYSETSGGEEAGLSSKANAKTAVTTGAYLVYDAANRGTLNLVWSRTKPTQGELLAFAETGKPVPEFKFQDRAGRHVLGYGCSGKKQFYEHYLEFLLEMAKGWKSKRFTMLGQKSGLEVRICLQPTRNNSVLQVKAPGQQQCFQTVHAIAVVHRDEDMFDVDFLDSDYFVSAGNRSGAAAIVDKH